MIEKVLNNKLISIAIFLVIGFLGTFSFFSKPFVIICIFSILLIIYMSRNTNEEVFILCSFIAGGEVFFRMIGGFILYETGKYAIIVFLLFGFVVGGVKNKFGIQYIGYIFLLIIGIIFTNVPEGESIQNAIVFNLSGPFVLGISALYFYQRKISKQKVFDALFFTVLPIFSIISYLYFRTPSIEEIAFGGSANFATSGGFGPNQVATAIGLGIFIISIFLMTKEKLTGFVVLDYFFLAYFVYRGLLTFSRGGIITGIASIVAFALFYFIYNKISFKIIFKYMLIISVFITGIWFYTSNITSGMLDNRYTGKNARGIQKEDITSGRGKIFNVQFENFIDNPIGIGVGNGKYERIYEQSNVTAASHNEVGRLLEEHGYLGFIILLILLVVPLFNFTRSNNYQRAFIISFYVLWFLTINHSAMRIALPGFIYGLSLIIITNSDE